MNENGQGFGARAALVTACAALAAFAACSRTDEPFERYAGSAAPPMGGRASAGATNASTAGTTGTAPGNEAGSGVTTGAGGGESGEGGAFSEAGSGNEPNMPVDVCGDAPISNAPFTKKALREAAADCATWHYCRFESAATALEAALNDYATTPDTLALDEARLAFARAMDLWSEIELFQFGPLASSAEAAGKDGKQGKGIRELIYAWPTTVRLRVEEQVVNRNYLTSWDSDVVLTSARGLFAIDYLLSYDGTDTQCQPTSVCGKNWAKHDDAGIAALKRDYAAGVGQDILLRIGELTKLWAPEGGNFRPLFVDATGYDDENQAMTTLAWALLYVEREVKDWKLGTPAGYTLNSPATLPEAPYSRRATDNIVHNLRGFGALYQGCGPGGEGLGFDDWLSEAGHAELAQDISQAWREAQSAADAFPVFDTATPGELEALYRAVKRLTDMLKNDLFGSGSPLGLTLPKGIEGDTD